MSLVNISQAERDYITSGCNEGLRFDGRGSTDFRTWSIENNVFPHVNGSARVKISDSTDILCSVKFEIQQPDLLHHDKGYLLVNADLSPSCNISIDDRKLEDISLEISSHIQRCGY